MEFNKKIRIFGRTRALEAELSDFLDKISTSALIFKHAIDIIFLNLKFREYYDWMMRNYEN